jgi:Na+/serine symporter
MNSPSSAGPDASPARGWCVVDTTPLYLRILGALGLGLLVGVVLGPSAAGLATPAKLILRLLAAIAPPLILLAIVRALVHAELPRGTAPRLVRLLLLNTTVAILIGLGVSAAPRRVTRSARRLERCSKAVPDRSSSSSITCRAACSARCRTTAA